MNGDITIPGVNDAQEFQAVKQAMNTLGISDAERDDIFRLVSIILMLGNIQFLPIEGSENVRFEESGT